MNKVSLEDIQQSITPEIVRTMRMISFASMVGVSLFFAVTILMYQLGESAKVCDRHISFVNTLTMINGALLFSCLVLSKIIQSSLFTERRFASMVGSTSVQSPLNIAALYIDTVRKVKIIYMAFLEVPATFGGVVCLLAIFNRVIYEHTYYWINAASGLVFILLMAMDLPTKDKLVELFKNKLKFVLTY